MFRNSLAAAASLLALTIATGASAADLPRKTVAPILTISPTLWTGFYLGGGIGYGMYNADTVWARGQGGQTVDQPLTQTQGGRGAFGSAVVGYDYRLSNKIVLGAFADFEASRIKGSLQNQQPFTTGDMTQNWAWAAGIRAGWLLTPSTLLYVNGGFTQAKFSGVQMLNNFSGTPAAGTQQGFVGSQTYNGWFLGGGFESAIGSGWFWRNEYRAAFYGNQTKTDTNITFPENFGFVTIKPVVHTFRSQITYKFNWGAAGEAQAYGAVSAEPSVNWSGFYAGLGGGYGLWNADTAFENGFSGISVPQDIPMIQGGRGFLGLASVGYDYQFATRFVIGLFGDYEISDVKGTLQDQNPFSVATTKQQNAWSVGARLGWLINPATMIYASGGYTSANFSRADFVRNIDPSFPPIGTPVSTVDAQTYDGWFLGAGVEANFAPGWFWRNEYRVNMMNVQRLENFGVPPVPIGPSFIRSELLTQSFRSQIVYKFNWGG